MLQTIHDVWSWLQNHTPTTIRPGLQRMEYVLQELGSPQRRLKYIHIAGTNGKGSVAAMLSSVLQEAGYSVGLYVSPPLDHYSERIQLDGSGIPDEELVRWAEHIRPIIEQMDEPPTLFEWWTLIAICYFAYEATPWFVIWETGLGGRLDATNVVHPLVSVITEIDLDHMEFLGNTLQAIAEEKAGIMKTGVPVIISAKNPEAIKVLKQKAHEVHSKCLVLGEDFHVKADQPLSNGQTFEFANRLFTQKLQIPLKGSHQLANAAAAIMALSILHYQYATIIDPIHLETGLAKVKWPGRLEEIGKNPIILLDGAHNASGIHALTDTLLHHYTYEKLFSVLATMKDKEEKMLQPLLVLSDHIVTTKVTREARSRTAEELEHIIHQLDPEKSVEAIESPERAVTKVLQLAGPNDLILIAGSLYLLSEIRPFILKRTERMG